MAKSREQIFAEASDLNEKWTREMFADRPSTEVVVDRAAAYKKACAMFVGQYYMNHVALYGMTFDQAKQGIQSFIGEV